MFDNYNRNDFEKYFNFADIDKFTIDLSNYNLIQVISKMISIKSLQIMERNLVVYYII